MEAGDSPALLRLRGSRMSGLELERSQLRRVQHAGLSPVVQERPLRLRSGERSGRQGCAKVGFLGELQLVGS